MKAMINTLPILAAMLMAERCSGERYSIAAQWSPTRATEGLRTVIGNVQKYKANPLFEQDLPWEPRIDNDPNVVHDPNNTESPWQCWYGDCVAGCGTQLLLYANSTDGIKWRKPSLGLFDVGAVRPDLAAFGTQNNILLKGGGIGVFLDPHETDVNMRYKAFGEGCFAKGGLDSCVRGFGASKDGLTFAGATSVSWPAPQRYDTHTNSFWDGRLGRYVVTTRDGFSADPGRTIGVTESVSGAFVWNTDAAPRSVERGTSAHQLYSQVTFPFLDAYLGIVSVFDSADASSFGHGKVHCRLSISTDLLSWMWVDAGGLTGSDLVPLGSGEAFDSHVCFAAASPVRMPDGSARIYYMGGNGPHSGARNSSFGLATLSSFDHFAGVAGSGNMTTALLNCTGKTLIVTADASGGGTVYVGLAGATPGDLSPTNASPIIGNVTDAAVRFGKAADFGPYVGSEISLELHVKDSVVYAVGFI